MRGFGTNWEVQLNYKNNLLNKLELTLLFFIIISLPLYCIPVKWRIPVLGSVLYYYPLLLLTVVFFVLDKRNMINEEIFKKYIIFGLVWGFFTIFYGLYIYPYFLQLGEPKGKAIEILLRYISFIDWNSDIGKFLVLFLKSAKRFLLDFLSGPIVMYMTYRIFARVDLKSRFDYFAQLVFIFSCIIIVFSIPELLLYKFGFYSALDIMIKITSFIQETTENYLSWYPPLVWHNEQLRSICTEPSMIGIFYGFAVPFIIWKDLKCNNVVLYFLYFYFTLIVVMSQAKTSIAMLGFHIITLFVAFFIFKKYRVNFLIFIILFCIGCLCGVVDFRGSEQQTEQRNIEIENAINSYFNNNISNVYDPKSGSSGSRLVNIKKSLMIGAEHFVTGVGVELRHYYIYDKLDESDFEIPEVQAIRDGIVEKGIYKYGFGNVNQYAVWFADQGVVGLIYYILPLFYFMYLFFSKKLFKNLDYFIFAASFLSMAIGMLAGAIATILIYIILGVTFSNLCINKKKLKYEI